MKAIFLTVALVLVNGLAMAQSDAVSGVPGSGPPAQPRLTFDGVSYSLAWVDVSGETVTNEYVPAGETLENWTTLIGVRQFRSARELRDVLPKYLAVIKPVLYSKPEFLKKDNVDASQEVTLILWLKAPGQTYVEYDLHRFVRTPSSVMAYQFAQKLQLPFAKKLDITPVLRRQASRISELNEASYTVHEK